MSQSHQIYYYTIVFIAMLFTFYKLRINKLSFLIIIVFWEGLFDYLGTITISILPIDIRKMYNAFVVLYIFFLTVNKLFKLHNYKERYIIITFLLFSASFWLSFILNGGNVIIILNQYLYKYTIIIFIYFYIRYIINNQNKKRYFDNIIIFVIKIQIFLSIIKIIIFGFGEEFIVGSVSYRGAAAAVVLPILFLIFYWLFKNGDLKTNDYIFTISLLIICIASGKRQPLFYFPFFFILLSTYVKKTIRVTSLIKFIPVGILLFYLGVRFTPSFTPESKVWGSFDFEYIINYSLRYYTGFGKFSYLKDGGIVVARNRIGGLNTFFKPKMVNLNTTEELLFGKGLYDVVSGAYGRFVQTGETGSYYRTENIGLVGNSVLLLYSIGYSGILSLIFLGLLILNMINNKRLRLVMVLYYFWDILFYYNTFIFHIQNAIIVYNIVLSSNNLNIYSKGKLYE